MTRYFMALFVSLVTFGLTADAALLRVGPSELYQSINTAYSASASGDTILIAVGDFQEDLAVSHRVHIIGGGVDLVEWRGQLSLNAGASRTTVEGVYLSRADRLIRIASGVDSVHLMRMRIHSTANYGCCGSAYPVVERTGDSPGARFFATGVAFKTDHSGGYDWGMYSYYARGDNAEFRNCIFAGNSSPAAGHSPFGGNFSSLLVQNSVFLSFRQIFNTTGSFPLYFVNNIIYDWQSTANWGTLPASGTIDYNASSDALPPGTNGILLTVNPFVNFVEADNYIFDSSDLHLDLANGAVCIDAGVPAILDLDGSPSDLGIYGGLTPYIDSGAPNYPFTSSMTVPPAITVGQQLQIEAQGRIGRGY